MLLLGLDFETTGLDVAADEITEIGAVLWETATQTPLRVESIMVWHENQKALTEDLQFLTGLTPTMLQEHGQTPVSALHDLALLMETPGLMGVVAHNGTTFDRPLLEANAKRWQVPLPKVHWIDTSVDIDYPAHIQTRKLTHLAAEHGFLNPFAHRAVFDVLTMLAILSKYEADRVLALSREPSIKVRAVTIPPWEDGGVSTNAAKGRGFRWDGQAKQWLRIMKASQLQREMDTAPFKMIAMGVVDASGAAG